MEKTLNKLKIGESGVIKTVSGDRRIRRRLLDMGITPGTLVFLRKVAPLGDPIEINIRGYELSLRKDEGKLIVVEVNK